MKKQYKVWLAKLVNTENIDDLLYIVDKKTKTYFDQKFSSVKEASKFARKYASEYSEKHKLACYSTCFSESIKKGAYAALHCAVNGGCVETYSITWNGNIDGIMLGIEEVVPEKKPLKKEIQPRQENRPVVFIQINCFL